MKTFDDFYKERITNFKIGASNRKMSMTLFLKTYRNMTRKEYRQYQLSRYKGKSCHSFWSRECVNKDIECHHCCHYYSIEDWDKMTTKERNHIKNS